MVTPVYLWEREYKRPYRRWQESLCPPKWYEVEGN